MRLLVHDSMVCVSEVMSDIRGVSAAQMGVIPDDDPEHDERFCLLRIMYQWGARFTFCFCLFVLVSLRMPE